VLSRESVRLFKLCHNNQRVNARRGSVLFFASAVLELDEECTSQKREGAWGLDSPGDATKSTE
jgi:hypothetical protein